MKFFKRNKSYAPGLPDRRITSPIPTEEDVQREFSVQEHNANRAGKHYDLRLGDPKSKIAYSWALRYWPEPGEKRLAIRQPDHTVSYMDWGGTIKAGYGAGKVRVIKRGITKIINSSENKINFEAEGSRYTLIRTSVNKWILLNRA